MGEPDLGLGMDTGPSPGPGDLELGLAKGDLGIPGESGRSCFIGKSGSPPEGMSTPEWDNDDDEDKPGSGCPWEPGRGARGGGGPGGPEDGGL